jgi:hypothetical protein
MLELFANPAALTVGGAMISAPILIHLINRMRFKRLRWAAMEFLLKSQKRNRRRLIIEQLLLLALRCLLIALAALLFARFRGCETRADDTKEQTPNLHVVLLNDSLSMRDKKGKDDCFVAGKRHIAETLAPAVGKSATPDKLVVLQLSRLVLDGDDYQPTIYDGLEDSSRVAALDRDLRALNCSRLGLPLDKGIARLEKMVREAGENSKVTIHVVSDFRKHRWAGDENRGMHQQLKKLALAPNVKRVYLIDTAEPERKTVLNYHDNLAITEMRPSTRITTMGGSVLCTVTVANYSIQPQEVMVDLFHYENGEHIQLADFISPKQFKIAPGKTGTATIRFPAQAKIDDKAENAFYRVGARLLNPSTGQPLDSDGLADDNVRYMAIEVRRKIPVLIIDGRGEAGLKQYGDSYFLSAALKSFSDKKEDPQIELVYGYKLGEGNPLAALESPDLNRFASIFLLNVPRLADDPQQEERRREILERYVRNGGGLAFFLGPNVNPDYYNSKLFNKGEGLFPVPLENTSQKDPSGDNWFTGRNLVWLREDQFSGQTVPIFGPMLTDPRTRMVLKFLHVKRFWPAQPYDKWNSDTTKVTEVANLPNEKPANEYINDIDSLQTKLRVAGADYKTYQTAFEDYAGRMNPTPTEVQGGKTVKVMRRASEIGAVLEELLNYSGADGKYPSLVEFWDLPDKRIRDLKGEVDQLRKKLLYSSPLILVRDFGQGRVAAFMSTAGDEWHNWAEGFAAQVTRIYPGFMFNLQNYLTSVGGDNGKILGKTFAVKVDGTRFPGEKFLMEGRQFATSPDPKFKPDLTHPTPFAMQAREVTEGTPRAGQPVVLEYSNNQTREPGYYQAVLFKNPKRESDAPLAEWTEVFNVDAESESNLERVSTSDINEALVRGSLPKGQEGNPDAAKIRWWRMEDVATTATEKPRDLSEWAPLYLFFLILLVAEQALAVHLSFHLRTHEAELPAQVVRPQARAA